MRFKRGTMIFVACLVAGLCLGLTNANAGTTGVKGPNAVVEGADYNFGSIAAGKDILHDFVIKNTGNQTLKIESVRTS